MSQNSGLAPSSRDHARGREERERRRDHLVAGPDIERHQSDQQRIGARRHADRVARLRVSRDLALELDYVRAEDESLRVADFAHRGFDLRA